MKLLYRLYFNPLLWVVLSFNSRVSDEMVYISSSLIRSLEFEFNIKEMQLCFKNFKREFCNSLRPFNLTDFMLLSLVCGHSLINMFLFLFDGHLVFVCDHYVEISNFVLFLKKNHIVLQSVILHRHMKTNLSSPTKCST